jgi:hypothetical protein
VLTKPLTEISPRSRKKNVSGGIEYGQCVRLTNLSPSVSRLSRQCGFLDISHTYTPPCPVMGITFTPPSLCIYIYQTTCSNIGLQSLTAVVMKGSIFWDITTCSPLKVNLLHAGFFLGLFSDNEHERDMFLLKPWMTQQST